MPRTAEAVTLLVVGWRLAQCSPSRDEWGGGGPELLDWHLAEQLAGETLANLTTPEKYALLNGVSWLVGEGVRPGYYVGTVPAVPRVGLPALKMQDSSNGYRSTFAGIVGTATVWPSPLAAASTWNEVAVAAQAQAIGVEFRGKGANVILGPAVNVHRVARGGRNFEYLSGEDPYLGARLARAFIRGVHTEGVMAVVKHWAFNEQETFRTSASSNVDDRTAWELYYPPFEAAVDEGAVAFMCAYNKVNWTQSCSNANLLTRDLRGAMGFRGFVMSDWDAAHGTTLAEGLDMDMPGTDSWFDSEHLERANQYDVYLAVRRILVASYRLRLHEQRGCVPPECDVQQLVDMRNEDNTKLARMVATEAVILLQNNDGLLPFSIDSNYTTIAVVGHAADAPPSPWHPISSGLSNGDFYSGGGSGHLNARSVVTALRGIKDAASWLGFRVLASPTDSVTQALAVAQEADVVVVVAGATTSEGADRSSLRLAQETETLIYAVSKVRPVVVLLQLPGPVLTPWRNDVTAIACLFYGGEETGRAWASVLFGDESPAGKLPVTMPASEADVIEPSWSQAVPYSEGIFTSYRSPSLNAAFPFGHGLSYTTFEYSNVSVTRASVTERLFPRDRPPGRPGVVTDCERAHVCARLAITNTGNDQGREVIQLYLLFPEYPDDPLFLRGFQKTELLRGGDSEEVTFALTERDCSRYSVDKGWEIQDHIVAHFASSSRDIRQVVPLPRLLLANATNSSFGRDWDDASTTFGVAANSSTTFPTTTTLASSGVASTLGGSLGSLPTKEAATVNARMATDVLVAPGLHLAGPTPVAPSAPPEERNNWILWLLQPLLLAGVLGGAAFLTRGVTIPHASGDMPREMWDAEDMAFSSSPGTHEDTTVPLVQAEMHHVQLAPL